MSSSFPPKSTTFCHPKQSKLYTANFPELEILILHTLVISQANSNVKTTLGGGGGQLSPFQAAVLTVLWPPGILRVFFLPIYLEFHLLASVNCHARFLQPSLTWPYFPRWKLAGIRKQPTKWIKWFVNTNLCVDIWKWVKVLIHFPEQENSVTTFESTQLPLAIF